MAVSILTRAYLGRYSLPRSTFCIPKGVMDTSFHINGNEQEVELAVQVI